MKALWNCLAGMLLVTSSVGCCSFSACTTYSGCGLAGGGLCGLKKLFHCRCHGKKGHCCPTDACGYGGYGGHGGAIVGMDAPMTYASYGGDLSTGYAPSMGASPDCGCGQPHADHMSVPGAMMAPSQPVQMHYPAPPASPTPIPAIPPAAPSTPGGAAPNAAAPTPPIPPNVPLPSDGANEASMPAIPEIDATPAFDETTQIRPAQPSQIQQVSVEEFHRLPGVVTSGPTTTSVAAPTAARVQPANWVPTRR
jgi:hypothetical protein